LAVTAAALLALTGCHADSASPGHEGVASVGDPRYGSAPTSNPNVTYQPDVVFVGGGATAIRSASDDWLTWRIDPNAKNAEKLTRGKIMFLSGRVVGRVLDAHRDGADLAVTLGPVDITEVIRDGTFASNGPVSLQAATPYELTAPFWAEADVSDESNDPSATPAVLKAPLAPEAGVARAVPVAFRAPAPSTAGSVPMPARIAPAAGFKVSPICCAGGVGAHFSYDQDGVRLVGTATLLMNTPSASFHLEIHGSSVTRAELEVSGGAGLRLDIEAATDAHRNIRKQLAVPVDFSIPIGQILGVPFAVTVNQVIGVTTAFSSKDGNIKASGEWALNQSIGFGYINGKFSARAPTELKVTKSLVDSISGISVGVSAIMVMYEAKFYVGIGAFGFTAGVYFKLATTAGITIGSALGSPIEVCRSAQVGVWAGYGVGYTLPAAFTKVINKFLELLNVAPIAKEAGIGEVKNVINKSVITPDVPICRG
jgi:hypothetical protein